MMTESWTRWSGWAALLGGLGAMGVFSVMALRPPGIPGGMYRQAGDLTPYSVISLCLLAVALAGIRAGLAQPLGQRGRMALALSIVGIIVGGAGGILGAVQDSNLVPLLIIPGFLGMILGMLTAGIVLVRQGSDWGRIGGWLILGSMAMFLFNTEDWRAWFGVLAGLAWCGLGYQLTKYTAARVTIG